MHTRSSLSRRKKSNIWWLFLIIILLLATAGTVIYFMFFTYKDTYDFTTRFNNIYTDNSNIYKHKSFAYNLAVQSVDKPEDSAYTYQAEAGVLCDISNSKVLFSRNCFNKMEPASTTKIMTAYLALKYSKLTDEVTVGEEVLGLDKASSMAGLKVGDKLTMEQLLYGLMLASGNDAANVIAKHVSGDISSFVELMNKEAVDLAAVDTHFMNPHGLPDENHYTSAYDLYLIINAALKFDEFSKIASSASYQANYSDEKGNIVTKNWINSNKFLNTKEPFSLPEGFKTVAGKTGTTLAAGNCLVLASKDGNSVIYVSVVLKAPDKTVLYDTTSKLLVDFAQ